MHVEITSSTYAGQTHGTRVAENGSPLGGCAPARVVWMSADQSHSAKVPAHGWPCL